jgi:preprotein translocase subunit SecE
VKPVLTYFSEVKAELAKVTWPRKDEVVRLTLTVFIISAAVGLYTGGLDLAFTKLLEVVISR